MIEVGICDYVVKKDLDWQVLNTQGYIVQANVFKKEYDLDEEPIDELIISFPECSLGSFLSINITAQIIGIPIKSKSIKIFGSSLIMPLESRRVLPISEGDKKFITSFKIESDYIEFNTFRELTKYGNKIIMKKQVQ
jgi:hypothetical protein